MSATESKYNNILLAKTAQAYHGSYIAEIAFKMATNKHLSVLIPSLMGVFPIIPNIYDILDYRDRLYVIVDSQEQILDINNILFEMERGNDCIYPILVDDFINNQPNGDCYILYDLQQDSRQRLVKILVDKIDKLVISVGKLSSIDNVGNENVFTTSHANGILNELYNMTLYDGEPHCMIFEMKSILDIRDIAFAEMSEKEFLLRRLYDVCNLYENDSKKTQPVLDSNDKLIMYQKAKEELELQINFLKMIATTAGVKVNELDESLEQIKKLKSEYSLKFEDIHDKEELEILENEFQTIIADLCVKVTKSLLTLDNRDKYEQTLMASLTEKVWNRLKKHSQMYLISALMTFESLERVGDKGDIDFSGVCLQVTKVLDEEMSLRLYDNYKVYLSKRKINEWPYAMKQKNDNGNFEKLPEYKFTIGSIAKVIGYDVKKKKVTDKKAFECMKEYSKVKLYEEGKTDIDIEKSLISIAVCAEKTRNDYRNPSAHRNTMSYISAKECIGYLVEQTKMLKEIMKDMRY